MIDLEDEFEEAPTELDYGLLEWYVVDAARQILIGLPNDGLSSQSFNKEA